MSVSPALLTPAERREIDALHARIETLRDVLGATEAALQRTHTILEGFPAYASGDAAKDIRQVLALAERARRLGHDVKQGGGR